MNQAAVAVVSRASVLVHDVVNQAVVAVVVVRGADPRDERPDEAVLYHVRAVRRHVEARRFVIGIQHADPERDVTGQCVPSRPVTSLVSACRADQ